MRETRDILSSSYRRERQCLTLSRCYRKGGEFSTSFYEPECWFGPGNDSATSPRLSTVQLEMGLTLKFFLEILFAYQHQCSFLMAVCRPSRNFPNFSFHHKFLEQQQRCKFSLSHRQSIGINLFHNG